MKSVQTGRLLVLWLAASMAVTSFSQAMITGGKGNKPLRDPGWPKGAAEVFNWKTRIAYWEGPPFGGGQWHAESKGDADEVNKVLQAFAAIESEKKRVILKDGIGFSFWLDPNGKKRGDRSTKIDWEFTVWVNKSWEFQKTLSPDLSAIGKGADSPVPQLTIYTASVNWSELKIPEGIEVDDRTLEGHGYERTDGRVIEGVVRDAATKQPILAVIEVQTVEPKKTGGYAHNSLMTIKSDADGKWVVKNFPDKWCRLIATAEGYAPRIFHYCKYDSQPGWESKSTSLAQEVVIVGKIVDDAGNGLSDAKIILRDVVAADGERYELLSSRREIGEGGEFRIEGIPAGKCRLTAYKDGYYGGLGVEVETPKSDCLLKLSQAGSLRVKVDFAGKPPKTKYLVNISPVGGDKVGSWGGSGNIDDSHETSFQNIPPGEYILYGRPNPGSDSEKTKEVKIKIEGGEKQEITLKAR